MDFHVLVDVQCLQTADLERGIPRWTTNFLRSFEKLNPGSVTGVFNPELMDTPGLDSLRSQFPVVPNDQRCLDSLKRQNVVYLAMSIYEPVRPLERLLPNHIPAAGIPVAAVMHDFVPHLFPDLYGYSELDRRLNRARESMFRSCDALLCNSESTAKDAIRCLGARRSSVHVVGSGIDDRFSPVRNDRGRLAELGVGQRFMMVVGRADPRKQTARMIDVYSKLPAEIREEFILVIACRVDEVTETMWRDRAAGLDLAPNQVVITGYLSDEDLRLLYSSTALFVEPSLYEGFGFPAAEAAACGAVALTSQVSSLPEVLDDPPATFDSTNIHEWVKKVEFALSDESFRAQRLSRNAEISQRHSWGNVATRAEKILRKIARPYL